jgi:hypothetical protein
VAHPARTVSRALLDGSGPVTRRIRVATDTPAPYVAGQNVATLELLLGRTVIATVPLLALPGASVEATLATASRRW